MAKIPSFKSKKTNALTPERGHTQKIPTIPYGESQYANPDFPDADNYEETDADVFFRNQDSLDQMDSRQQTSHTQAVNTGQTSSPVESDAYAKLKAQRAERKRKTIIKRSIIAAIIIAILGGCIAWYFMMDNKNTETEEAYVTDSVTAGDYSTDINASGSVKPISSVVVTPEIDGIVETVKVSEGDTVKKGDVLFTIKNNDLDRAVTEASRNIRKSERAVQEAQHALNDAIAAQQAGVSSSQSYDLTNSDSNAAESARDGEGDEESNAESMTPLTQTDLDDAVVNAQYDLEDAQYALADANDAYKEAVKKADARTVKSPINGTLISFKVIKGSALEDLGSESGQPLVQIANVSKMKVSVQVNEVDITKLEVGQKGIATFAALPDISLNAKIKTIASASTSNGAEGGGNATYTVELVIDEPDKRLKSGMTADIVISTDVHKNVLMVSPAALRTDDGQEYYVIRETDPETHQGVRVKVGVIAENGISAAVAGDLEMGDTLIISGEGEILDEDEDPGRKPALDGTMPDADLNAPALDPGFGGQGNIPMDDMGVNPEGDNSPMAR